MITCEELDVIHGDTVKLARMLCDQMDTMCPIMRKQLVSMLREVLSDFAIELHGLLRLEGFNTNHQTSWGNQASEYRKDIHVYLDQTGLRVHRLVITVHPAIPTLIYSEGPGYMGTIRGLIEGIRAARVKEQPYDYCSTCHYYTNDTRLRLCGKGLQLAEGCSGYRVGFPITTE